MSLKEDEEISTLSALFSSAGWLEREVWDLFGVYFENHQDLRRILTDYGFVGHPLRKDFPMTGFEELFYDESLQRIIYQPVILAQEYREYYVSDNWKALENIKRGA